MLAGMTVETPRNSFRAAVVRGERPELLVSDKAPKLAPSDETLRKVVPRSERRRANHREQDRHRLPDLAAKVRTRGKEHDVELINLSGGGAMLRGSFRGKLWDIVELELDEGIRVEAAVRWLRDELVGLEFAHETRIDCDPGAEASLLREVIQRSFPQLALWTEEPPPPVEPCSGETERAEHRTDKRHPLIWNGVLHHRQTSHPVRLRNISSGGALVDIQAFCPKGIEVVLDLGGAGKLNATVGWAHGEQVGLRFHEPFDLACLANARPEVTPQRWVRPSFLDSAPEDDTPWHLKWKRRSVAELAFDLEGFLKR
jgi:hypothetical protein